MSNSKSNILYIFLCVLIFVQFFDSRVYGQSDSVIIVQGVIDTVPNARYYFSYTKNGQHYEDTIKLDSKRKFEYRVSSTEPLCLYISIDNAPGSSWYDSTRVGSYTVYNFWVEPGKRTYFKGKKKWSEQVVKNSKTEEEKIRFYRMQAPILNNIDKEHKNKRTMAFDSLRKVFITQNSSTYYSLHLLNGMIRNESSDYPFIEAQLAKLPADLKKNHIATDLQKRIDVARALLVGKVMPDFEQTDSASNPVRLSTLRGKYILVDFWASWCVPCRKQNPFLVDTHQKFASKGFDILGVSLDTSKENWIEAIQKDQLNWTHVSDLKGFGNAVAKQFFIHSVPDNFLLNPEGVIIGRDLNEQQLLKELERIFGE